MGCDGGTIPKRDELVKTKKRPEKNAKEVENAAKWNYCHLSQELLRSPIVADLLGYLYNKDALIEYLLERSKYEAGPSYVKSLKEVKELNLTANPGFKDNQIEKGNEFIDANKSRWICPITGLEMNGIYKFYYIFTCGCVISERAIKSMSNNGAASAATATTTCLKCDKSYNENDLIVLNPNDDDLTLNQDKFNVRKSSKTKAPKVTDVKNETKSEKTSSSSSSINASTNSLSSSSSLKSTNSTSTSLKRPHVDNVKTTSASNGIDSKKAKTGTSSIQSDPNASSVYKSLFTSCDKAKNQTKAHWVTYNPQYF